MRNRSSLQDSTPVPGFNLVGSMVGIVLEPRIAGLAGELLVI